LPEDVRELLIELEDSAEALEKDWDTIPVVCRQAATALSIYAVRHAALQDDCKLIQEERAKERERNAELKELLETWGEKDEVIDKLYQENAELVKRVRNAIEKIQMHRHSTALRILIGKDEPPTDGG
ncbi:MAG: hypothetical protein V3W19_08520, partial [Desulfatiglandales bacterium]